MIGLLRAILAAILDLRAHLDGRLDTQDAAIEHIRSLIEDGDPSPAAVGAPTFTAGEHQ